MRLEWYQKNADLYELCWYEKAPETKKGPGINPMNITTAQ